MISKRFLLLVPRLAQLKPGSADAEELRWALERLLMKAILVGGRRAVDRAIAALNARGRRFSLAETRGSLRTWRESLADGQRVLEIRANVSRTLRTTLVQYRAVRVPRLTRGQLERHARQQRFYARYLAAGQRAYAGDGYRRLSRADRLVLLIGELEADVNNGGFSQYLGNKGRRRARSALQALTTVGARSTARMLATALAPRVTPEQLDALDTRFYAAPEDLAVLTVRFLERGKGTSPSSP